MSLATWKAKYYPIEADLVPKEEALAHALQKWKGLYPSILKRYRVRLEGRTLVCLVGPDTTRLDIDVDSCALCHHYAHSNSCPKCPLYLARQGVRCDKLMGDELGSDSPYGHWLSTGDPRPMIHWLEKNIQSQHQTTENHSP